MANRIIKTYRYTRSWLRGGSAVTTSEIMLDRAGHVVPATLVRPTRTKGPLPGWVVLHGISRPGRDHRQLRRMVDALVSSGAAALIPEVPEWRELELAPEQTLPTVRAALTALADIPEVQPAPYALMAFSFGAAQALIAASDPEVAEQLGSVVGFGGYCDLEETLRFQFAGTHEWHGQSYQSDTDAYGRWIVGANYLTEASGFEQHDQVRDAVRGLAIEAGERQAPIGGAYYAAFAKRVRQTLPPESQPVFDLFVHPGRPDPDAATVDPLVQALTSAARRVSPLMDPREQLAEVRVPVHLVHGRADTLIPFTQTLRIGEALPSSTPNSTTITSMFAHSRAERPQGLVRTGLEAAAFLRSFSKVLTSI